MIKRINEIKYVKHLAVPYDSKYLKRNTPSTGIGIFFP